MSSKNKTNKPDTLSQVSRSGHLWQVCDNPDKPYMLMMHKSGHHVWLREDGSVQIKAVKSPSNNQNSGKLIIHCMGDALIKVDQDCHFDVGGKLTFECDSSIDFHAYKDINMRAEGNFNINCGKNFTVSADQAASIASKSKVTQSAPKVTVNTDIQESTVTGPQNDAIFGERTISMIDPRGTFTLLSLGHMITTVKGDHEKVIGGRESEKILGLPPVPPLPTIPPGGPTKLSIIGASGGLGRVEKIMTGNDVSTVVVGNKISNVVAGNSVLTAGAGTITMAAGVNATITATANVTIAGASVFLN